jgi:hypothetical protein
MTRHPRVEANLKEDLQQATNMFVNVMSKVDKAYLNHIEVGKVIISSFHYLPIRHTPLLA